MKELIDCIIVQSNNNEFSLLDNSYEIIGTIVLDNDKYIGIDHNGEAIRSNSIHKIVKSLTKGKGILENYNQSQPLFDMR